MRLLIAAAALTAFTTAACADQYVNGYFRNDGTYVDGHYRSNQNDYTFDNYSSKGNTNPYTGERGTVDPYAYRAPSGGYGGNNLNRYNKW